MVLGWFASSGVFIVSLIWSWLCFCPLGFLLLLTSLPSDDCERGLAVVLLSLDLQGVLRFCIRVALRTADTIGEGGMSLAGGYTSSLRGPCGDYGVVSLSI